MKLYINKNIISKLILCLFITTLVFTSFSVTSVKISATGKVPVYRVYKNKHYRYTANKKEYNKWGKKGWKKHGIAWYAPTSGKNVYGVYHKKTNDAIYTTSKKARNKYIKKGWKKLNKGRAIFKSGGTVPIYRYYKKKNKIHFYTSNKSKEKCWKKQGIAIRAIKKRIPTSSDRDLTEWYNYLANMTWEQEREYYLSGEKEWEEILAKGKKLTPRNYVYPRMPTTGMLGGIYVYTNIKYILDHRADSIETENGNYVSLTAQEISFLRDIYTLGKKQVDSAVAKGNIERLNEVTDKMEWALRFLFDDM